MLFLSENGFIPVYLHGEARLVPGCDIGKSPEIADATSFVIRWGVFFIRRLS
jgi:hypothetical protein